MAKSNKRTDPPGGITREQMEPYVSSAAMLMKRFGTRPDPNLLEAKTGHGVGLTQGLVDWACDEAEARSSTLDIKEVVKIPA